jgi:hypothetical protein
MPSKFQPIVGSNPARHGAFKERQQDGADHDAVHLKPNRPGPIQTLE